MTMDAPPDQRQDSEQRLQEAFGNQWAPSDWLLAKQMLRELDSLLQAAGIRFFLLYGTYLGAVRHQGVIPWDDDMDIGIFAADERKLDNLAPRLKERSYGIIRISRPRGDFQEIFYKIWIDGRPVIPGKRWSWPFIDIFVARPMPADAGMTLLDHRPFPSSMLSELELRHFAGMQLPCPRGTDLLKLHYGDHCLDVYYSSYWSHKDEHPKPVIASRRRAMEKLGFLVDVDRLGEAFLDGRWMAAEPAAAAPPGKAPPDGLAALRDHVWGLLQAGASVRQMLDLRPGAFELPAIRATGHILQCLEQWRMEGRIEPAAGAS